MLRSGKYFIPFTFLLLFFPLTFFCRESLTEIENFGDNPGNLVCFIHVPDSIPSPIPVVVSLHGCGESAADCARLTEWNKLADKYGFIVIYPQQKLLNNPNGCFDWFMPDDRQRGKGEPASIVEMVNYTETKYKIDSTKIFVSGLSAGAAMADILLATYPDIFSKGAIFAGGAYGLVNNAGDAISGMSGGIHKTPEELGDKVRNADHGYHGNYPAVIIFQGEKDLVVDPSNANEIVKQWANVHETDTIPDKTDTMFNNNPLVTNKIYLDSSGKTVVSIFTFKKMGHAIPVDPGNEPGQGGKTGMFAKDVDFYSIYYAAKFFGLVK
ncbi:MAG: PHB depolymerase family esterase [Bacteroidetes bacterium]|nr:PHB depolymerase family esterase [Bacteroidota bacterium]